MSNDDFPRCFKCNKPIYFAIQEIETPSGKPTVSQRNGKKIPLDTDTMEPHDCPDSPYHHQNRIVECWNCGEEITFSDDEVSESGRKIPLDPETYDPHTCLEYEKKDDDADEQDYE